LIKTGLFLTQFHSSAISQWVVCRHRWSGVFLHWGRFSS